MGWRARRTSLAALESTLVEESAAFLSGRYLEAALAAGGEAPAWLWLSTLAHGDEASVLTEGWPGPVASKRPELETWSRVLGLLAREVRELVASGCGLAEVQRDILIPLELAIMTSPVGPATLYRLVSSVLGHARHQVESDRP